MTIQLIIKDDGHMHTHTSSQHIVYLLGRGKGTYVDNQSLHHTKYTPYKVVYSWLLYKLSGGTGILVDYLWFAYYRL